MCEEVLEKLENRENLTVEFLVKVVREIVEMYERYVEETNATIATLKAENDELKKENERLRRIINNNSQNSSLPPSKDQKPFKSPNEYNSREKTDRKKGGQKGHAGKTVTKEQARELIRSGKAEHRIMDVGDGCGKYVSKYVLDLQTKVVITEIRFYENERGKIEIPEEFHSDVTYGEDVKALCTLLYGEGVVSNDRIQMIVSSLSDGVLPISTGTIYNICKQASILGSNEIKANEAVIIESPVMCTDATTITVNGKQAYIRNYSTKDACIYEYCLTKSMATLKESRILPKYKGIVEHDHETSLYNFGSGHGECNAHLLRYLTKNTEETKNSWSDKLASLLCAANKRRVELVGEGKTCFPADELSYFVTQYDTIVTEGQAENSKTNGYTAKKAESRLLRRLVKYKKNHLLFLYNFAVPFTNNMSERDLRKCKNRQKMAGGFRTEEGCKMYCKILSLIENYKRKGRNLMDSLRSLFHVNLTGFCYTPV